MRAYEFISESYKQIASKNQDSILASKSVTINETLLYRGTSIDTTEPYIEWYSTDKDQAIGYSNHRENSHLITKNLDFDRVIEFDRDSLYIKPKTFATKALQGADRSKINIKDALKELKKLEDFFGDTDIPVIDYWKDNKSKKVTHDFLKYFEYDAIKIREDGIDTYGVLK